jgi:hypothetical protein
MARSSWRTLKAGDLLSIPVDEDRIAIGHVIDQGQEIYLRVYQPLFSVGEVVPDLSNIEVALIARTTDELIWHGRWTVIGWQEPPANVPRPPYVVDTPGGLRLRTFHGGDLRPADEQDLATFGRQFSISNIKFCRVMRHIHGIEPYPDDFSRITYSVACKRAALA